MSRWKDLAQLGVRSVLRPVSRLFPIRKRRILFWSFRGYQYSCSPKYLSEYLHDHFGKEFELVWAFRDPEKWDLPDGIRKVRYRSIPFFYFHFTAGFIVTNIYPIPLVCTRERQCLIDTWHGGGAYKAAGFDSGNRGEFRQLEFSRRNISVFLSSSRLFSEYFVRGGMRFKKEILNTGLPRNDIFFYSPERQGRIIRDVRDRLGLAGDAKLLLYAPTWRERDAEYELDPERLRAAFAARFAGRWAVLFRTHMKTGGRTPEGVLDVSGYPDMQELLLASDALITDYSSSIWDYGLTGKPCFLYAYDLDQYREGRSFYLDIREWGFPVCETFDGLLAAVEAFDEEQHRRNMREHYRKMGGYDRGNACAAVASYILEHAGLPGTRSRGPDDGETQREPIGESGEKQ